MNRNLYLAGIFLYTANMAVAAIIALSFWKLGMPVFENQTFITWQMTAVILSLTGDVILLKYFHYKKYLIAFRACLITMLAFLVDYTLYRIDGAGYVVTLYVSLITLIFYSLTLVFSNASERPSLKIAGVLGAIFGLVLIALLTMMSSIENVNAVQTLERIYVWVSLAGNLILLWIIRNFYDEMKLTRGPILQS